MSEHFISKFLIVYCLLSIIYYLITLLCLLVLCIFEHYSFFILSMKSLVSFFKKNCILPISPKNGFLCTSMLYICHGTLHFLDLIGTIFQTLLDNLSKEVGSPVKIGNFLRVGVGEGIDRYTLLS